MVLGTIVTFVVALLVGGLGIYVGGRVIADQGDYGHAVWTALLGALGWALTGGLIALVGGWIPILGIVFEAAGFVVGLVVYLLIVNLRYRGGWIDAALIAAIAWGSSVVVLFLISPLLGPIDVVGVPFV